MKSPLRKESDIGSSRKPRQLFGTDGIRGKAGQLLTPALAMQVGFWAGKVLQQEAGRPGPFMMGQDSRCSSDMLAMSLASGLTAAGLDVWNMGLCPTPAVAYLTHRTEALGGVMISASHNPPEDNGIKFFGADGAKLSLGIQQAIEDRLYSSSIESVTGHIWGRHHHRSDLTQVYLESLQTPFNANLTLQGMKIVLDLAWGAATQLAPDLFRQMGAEVICLHDRPDGTRINVNCGSTHLETLREAVVSCSADIGFAFDGDADRVLAIDCSGRTVDGDYILYLWGQHLKQAQKLPNNTIVATVMSNLGFERAWQKQGGQLVRAAVGDQYVHAEMLNHNAMLGGEQSGHILCRHYGIGGDGLQTALHIAAIVKQAGVPIRVLVDASFATYPQLLRNVRVEDRDRRCRWQECEPLQAAICEAEAAMGDRGRILVRASGTEPLIRVMVEAADFSAVHHWCDRLVDVVNCHLAN
ncbi:phosphoglucosamine mutase [Altericista sp. CCNU0014]|uniref:phosphoglucosamine mutase n=1 Tax=Altericista sp. CCNU0014 TaxID=3082949 RepID=UPI00384FFF40